MASLSDSFLKKHPDFNKISAVCLTGNVEAVEAVLNEATGQSASNQQEEPNVEQFTDRIGWTPLHYACQQGSPEVVELLLNRGFSCLAANNDGNTPLHIACITNKLEAVKQLLGSSDHQKCLQHKNKEGNTPLHIACSENFMSIAEALVEKCFQDDHSQTCVCRLTNERGTTPLGMTIQQSHYDMAQLLLKHTPGNPTHIYSDLISHVPTCSHIASISAIECDPIEVFVMGDSGSGKSSLVKTLHTHSEGLLSRLYTMIPYIRINTDSEKVGIVPTAIEYSRRPYKCPIVLHELTGNCNYTHEALKRCTQNPLNAIYLVTVDLRESPVSINRKLLFWLSYLRHQLAQFGVTLSPTDSLTMKLKVLVVGTFYDQTTVRDRAHWMLNCVCVAIFKENEKLMEHFSWLGSYTFNTRKAYSWGINQLRQVFHDQCQQHYQLSPTTLVPAQCYLLASLLSAEFASVVVVSLSKIAYHLSQSDDILCRLLPTQDALIELCLQLQKFSQFVVIEKARSLEEIFIICNYSQLSSDIYDAFEQLEHAHGIVRSCDLKEAFEHCEYPEGFIMHYLELFSLCEPVPFGGMQTFRHVCRRSFRSASESTTTPQPTQKFRPKHQRGSSFPGPVDLAKMLAAHSSTDLIPPEMPYYFIPSLLPPKPNDTNWKDSDHKYPFGFAWSLVPRSNQECQFFTPHIATVLLFRLLSEFTPLCPNHSMPLERQCDLWQSGISWSSDHGTRACVVIHEYQSITLSMQCFADQEINCLRLRNHIIAIIHRLKTELHPDIKTDEFLIPQNETCPLPIYDPTTAHCFNKTDIEKAIKQRHSIVMCTKSKEHLALEQVLFFEPFCFRTPAGPALLNKLFNADNTNCRLEEDFCMSFAKELEEKWKILAVHFELQKWQISDLERIERVPYVRAHMMLRHVRDAHSDGPHTYGEMRDSLLAISIFREDEVRARVAAGGNEANNEIL